MGCLFCVDLLHLPDGRHRILPSEGDYETMDSSAKTQWVLLARSILRRADE